MAFIEDTWVRKDRTRTERYGRGLRYRVEWVPAGGKKRRKSFATKALAELFLAQLRADVHRGVYPAPVPRRTLFGDYARTWERQQVHQHASTAASVGSRVRHHIVPALGHLALEDVTRQDMQAAVLVWAETLAPSTVKIVYSIAASIFHSAVLDGLIPASPCVKVKLPRAESAKVRPFTVEQVRELVGVMGEPFRPLAVFCAATGMRSGEMLGLTWDRVDLEAGTVTVDRQLARTARMWRPVWGPPKTESSERTISVGPATVAMLQGLERGVVGGLVFGRTDGGAIGRGAASVEWRRVRAAVSWEAGRGWHQLRHHHASLLIAGGMSPVAVAHRLGHKDANETLRTYAHLWSDDDDRAARLSDGLVKLPPPVHPPG